MRRRNAISRRRQRQEMLRELASNEAVCVMFGKGNSRAVEAVEALRRIQDGTYGTCADCGETIPAARLQAKPEATRCITCQTEHEQRSGSCVGDWNHVALRSA